MLVVVAFVAIMAALISRSFSHAKDSLADKALIGDLRSEITRAHLKAIQDGQIVTLQYDPVGRQFTLNEAPVQDASNTQTPELITDMQNQQTSQVHAIPLPADSAISFTDFQVGSKDQGAGQWSLPFYPDGTSDGGGAQITIGKAVQSIKVDTHGVPTVSQGPLADPTNDLWPVGTYYQRPNA